MKHLASGRIVTRAADLCDGRLVRTPRVDWLRRFTQVVHRQTTTTWANDEGWPVGQQVNRCQCITDGKRLYRLVSDNVVADNVSVKSDRDEQHLIAWREHKSRARRRMSACTDVKTLQLRFSVGVPQVEHTVITSTGQQTTTEVTELQLVHSLHSHRNIFSTTTVCINSLQPQKYLQHYYYMY